MSEAAVLKPFQARMPYGLIVPDRPAAIKKCKAFYQCLEDRDRGKVKHCYENDRRWR